MSESMPVTAASPAKKAAAIGAEMGHYLPGRREAVFLGAGGVLGAGLGVFGARRTAQGAVFGADRDESVELTPKQVQELLAEGNARFTGGTPARPDQGPARRAAVSQAEKPLAVVLCCSDSRVVPELLFDQGLGDLFVVRAAGQVVDDAVLGSLQYGVGTLATPLLVVLGHSGCSAVRSAVEAEEKLVEKTAKTPAAKAATIAAGPAALNTAIAPAVREAQRIMTGDDDLVTVATGINVDRSVDRLKTDPVIGAASSRRAVKVVGALYDLATGEVDWA